MSCSLSQCLLNSLFPLPGVLENAPSSAYFHLCYNFEIIRNIFIFKQWDIAIACCKPDHGSGPLWDTGLCTDLQLGSLLFCGTLNFKATLRNNCIWFLGSRQHQPTQTTQVSSEVVSVGGYICVYCAKNSCSWPIWFGFLHWFIPNFVWVQCWEVHSHAVAVFHTFRYPSDAHRGDQDCSRTATHSKTRLVKKLAVWILVRNWSGMKMKNMSNEQVNRLRWGTSLQN